MTGATAENSFISHKQATEMKQKHIRMLRVIALCTVCSLCALCIQPPACGVHHSRWFGRPLLLTPTSTARPCQRGVAA